MQCYHCDNAATATIVSCLQDAPDRWVCDEHATTRGGVMLGRCPDCNRDHKGPCACPFCGEYGITFAHTQGTKWGQAECLSCGARGPEVRTGYDISEGAPWNIEACAKWNTRRAG